MSNSLDPGQIHRFVVPDLGPSCFQMISADGKAVTNRKRIHQDPPERTNGNNSASLCEERIRISIIEFMSRRSDPNHKYLKMKKGNKKQQHPQIL